MSSPAPTGATRLRCWPGAPVAARLTGQGQRSRCRRAAEPAASSWYRAGNSLRSARSPSGAEQGKGAGFNRYPDWHDVCSFIKFGLQIPFFQGYHSRKNVVINTTFSQNIDSRWCSFRTTSTIGHLSTSRSGSLVRRATLAALPHPLPDLSSRSGNLMDRVRNLLEQIQDRLEELNKAERKVAEVILLNPQQATRFSIAALAQAARSANRRSTASAARSASAATRNSSCSWPRAWPAALRTSAVR